MAAQIKRHSMNSCGQVTPQLAQFAAQNAPFSQRAWEIMKQDGCAPCTAQALPTWPPKDSTAFTYPMMANMEEVAGLDTATYGAPYMPTAAEQDANDPASLVCSLPPELRGSQFLPETPMSASNLSIPALDQLNFDLATNDSGNLVPMSGDTPVEDTQSEAPSMVAASAKEMQTDLAGVAYDLTHMDSVPGESVGDKLGNIWAARGRSLLLWALFVVVLAVMLSLIM